MNRPALHLAPMADVTDAPMRAMSRRGGADVCTTEMVSAEGLVRGSLRTRTLMARLPEEGPLVVQLYGNQNRTLHLTVGRDGRVNFPELGPISVGGQRFRSVQSALEARVAKQMIGVSASVSMGDIRAIRVFVLGEAEFIGAASTASDRPESDEGQPGEVRSD